MIKVHWMESLRDMYKMGEFGFALVQDRILGCLELMDCLAAPSLRQATEQRRNSYVAL